MNFIIKVNTCEIIMDLKDCGRLNRFSRDFKYAFDENLDVIM